MAPARHRRLAAALLAAAVVVPLAGLGSGLVFLLPAALALGALALGWFPGERALAAALGRRARAPRRVRAPRAIRAARAPRTAGPSGGALLGARLAGRAPPLPA